MSGPTRACWCVCVCVCVAVLLAGAQDLDLCERCECLPPGAPPLHAFCRPDANSEGVFSPTTTLSSRSLELLLVDGVSSVHLAAGALQTDNPLSLLLLSCVEVEVEGGAVPRLRTLVVRGATRVHLGVQPTPWATVLEDIGELHVSAGSLRAEYSLRVGRVGALSVQATAGEGEGEQECREGEDHAKTLIFNSKINAIPEGGLVLCGSEVTLNSNTFTHLPTDGLQISTEGMIAIIFNTFLNVSKQSFNLSSAEIHLSHNHFLTVPAGLLRDVSTLQDTFFTNNTLEDADLGGLLLDMGWDMVLEQNTVICDCASRRTSILDPKGDMLYLTNTSYEKLNTIFELNFCRLACPVSLMAFSQALKDGTICATNDTELEEEVLCPLTTEITEVTDTTSFTADDLSSTENPVLMEVSAANRLEIIIPLCVVCAAVLFSLLYGCRELSAFKYKFKPNLQVVHKVQSE